MLLDGFESQGFVIVLGTAVELAWCVLVSGCVWECASFTAYSASIAFMLFVDVVRLCQTHNVYVLYVS